MPWKVSWRNERGSRRHTTRSSQSGAEMFAAQLKRNFRRGVKVEYVEPLPVLLAPPLRTPEDHAAVLTAKYQRQNQWRRAAHQASVAPQEGTTGK